MDRRSLLVGGGALGLAGCVGTVQPGQGGDVQVSAVSTVLDLNGEIRLDSIRVAGFPYTYPIRAWGSGRIFLQVPAKPYVRFEGEGGWVIEPLVPSDAARLTRAIRMGDVELPKGVTLAPVGSIARFKREG